MLKKIVSYIVNAVSIIAIVASVFVLLMVVFTKPNEAPNVFGYSVFRVLTGSMEPTIQTDSLIVVRKTEPSQIKVGDVISFYSQDPVHDGAVNTHRVTSIEDNGSSLNFVTKGDANLVEDKYLTAETDLVGKVVYVSHPLGVAVHLMSNPLIFLPLIALPLFIILIYNLVHTIRVTKGIIQEEEEAAIREAVEAIRKKREEEKEEER